MLSPYGLKTACRHAIAADKVAKRSIIAAGRGLRKGLTAYIAEQIACKQIRFAHSRAAIDLNVLIYPTATRQNLTGRDKRQREIFVGHPAVQYFDAAGTAIAAAALVFDLVAGSLQALQ